MNEEEILKQLKIWNEAYRKGESLVPDSVYDAMVEKLPEDHIYRLKPESEEFKNRVKHSKPMLSMQKAKTKDDIIKWQRKVINAANDLNIKPLEILIKCSAKLDGIAGKYENGKFLTRGDGIFGNDVTETVLKGVVYDKESLGEFVVKLDYFNDNLTNFSHPRNFVSGAIMSDELSNITNRAFKDKAVIFQSYSDLPCVSFPITTIANRYKEAESFVKESVNYQIDGMILEVVDEEIKQYMGETSHHPNWAIALKPEDKIYQSTITKIDWQVGRTGKVTPVINIEPVDIEGVIVQRASGHNALMVKTLGLCEGIKVDLIRSGSVIPYIVGVSDE